MKNAVICGFHSRFHTCSICAPAETRHTSITHTRQLHVYTYRHVYAVACRLPLCPERVVACMVSLSVVSSGCAKLLLVESGFPDLFFVRISLGFVRFFYEHA